MPEHLPEPMLELRDRTRAFITDVLTPLEAQIPLDQENVPAEIAAEVRERSRQAGFFFMTQPAEFGGQPAGVLELTMLREEFAASNLRLTQWVFGPGPGILARAEGSLKDRYLAPVLRGEKRGAFGFTEPDDAERPTWARRDGSDLVITGRKSYVTGGDRADFISVLVNVEASDSEPKGTAMVVVDREAPGVIIDRRFSSLDGSGHVSITLEGVRVPQANVIGKIGEGMPRALGNIGNVRLSVSAEACGLCQWVLEYLAGHLSAPHRSGTPLGSREGVRLRYADMRIESYAARSMLYRTARLAEAGENVVNETIMTKVYCTETVGRVVDMGVQLVGGQALVHGHPLEALYRRVRAMRLMEGASDLLRINLIKGKLEMGLGRI